MTTSVSYIHEQEPDPRAVYDKDCMPAEVCGGIKTESCLEQGKGLFPDSQLSERVRRNTLLLLGQWSKSEEEALWVMLHSPTEEMRKRNCGEIFIFQKNAKWQKKDNRG